MPIKRDIKKIKNIVDTLLMLVLKNLKKNLKVTKTMFKSPKFDNLLKSLFCNLVYN